MVVGETSSMIISCGQFGVLSVYCVCQIVFVSPSTALAPLPSSPAVSSLSALTNLSLGVFTGAVGVTACVTGATTVAGCVAASGGTEPGGGDMVSGAVESQPAPT